MQLIKRVDQTMLLKSLATSNYQPRIRNGSLQCGIGHTFQDIMFDPGLRAPLGGNSAR